MVFPLLIDCGKPLEEIALPPLLFRLVVDDDGIGKRQAFLEVFGNVVADDLEIKGLFRNTSLGSSVISIDASG